MIYFLELLMCKMVMNSVYFFSFILHTISDLIKKYCILNVPEYDHSLCTDVIDKKSIQN